MKNLFKIILLATFIFLANVKVFSQQTSTAPLTIQQALDIIMLLNIETNSNPCITKGTPQVLHNPDIKEGASDTTVNLESGDYSTHIY